MTKNDESLDMRGLLAAYSMSSPADRSRFLANLIFFIGQAARGAYVEAGINQDLSVRKAKAFNEMGLIVATELMTVLSKKGMSRSAQDLFDSIFHWGNIGGCREDAMWALRKAWSSDSDATE
jgi:hypothetical protein